MSSSCVDREKLKIMLAKVKIILLVVVISSVTLIQTVEGASHVHVNVPGAPINVGSSFHITFGTDRGYNGIADVYVDHVPQTPGSNNVWASPGLNIIGGLDYTVTAPGISTPGSYIATVTFNPSGGGSVEQGTSLFSVVGPASATTTSSTTTSATTTNAAVATTDWAIQSVSLIPSTPQVGNPVTFSAVLTAFSSSSPFPQSVHVECTIDGVSC